ncbi:hypothetical protein [Nocardiopsis sp. NPDC006938]|uniref:hypothetical protein n=1 Tax=Nocardiopsis sp. NPDC006938 TaxID=3364337 RepID=UPI00367FA8E5
MTTTSQNGELTPNERKMLRLLTMLPAPDRRQGDDVDVRRARTFWNTMSDHLGTVRGPEGQIRTPAVHAGALIEEGIIGLRAGLEAEDASPLSRLRVSTRWLAQRLFDIFGELSDQQLVALRKALSPALGRASSGLAHEWLRQLREAALNVILETIPIEMDSKNEFDFLDKSWGHPDHDVRLFPTDLDGVLKHSAPAGP